MALKVGANEAERFQVITALRAGQSWGEATAALRKTVEPDWFERNEEHLALVAAEGETKPSPVVLVSDAAPASVEPAEEETPAKTPGRRSRP